MNKRETPIEVSCYAGHRYPERPLSFKLLERTFQVKEVLDQWYGENHIYFKVRADDLRVYLLGYQEDTDHWTLAGMAFSPRTTAESHGEVLKGSFFPPRKGKEGYLA
jgi:hypothetical protein